MLISKETLYRAFSRTVKAKRNLILEKDFFDEWQKAQSQSPDSDYYESIFLYNEEQKQQYLNNNKSLSGITEVVTDRLVFDFDSKEDIDLARKDAYELINNKLLPLFNASDIRLSCSGNKGFHVEVYLNSLITQEQFKNIVFNVAGEYTTFDESVNDPQRVFRLPLTVNKATGKYKIPITLDQMEQLETEEILNLASSPSKDNEEVLSSYTVSDVDVVSRFYKVQQKKELKTLKRENRSPEQVAHDGEPDHGQMTIDERPDFTNKPSHLSEAKYTIQEGFFENGERNEACMILASTYKYLGYNKELAYNMIKATLRMRAARLGLGDYDKQELWKTVIEPVYSPNWKGGIYSEETGLLRKTVDRYTLNKVSSENFLVNLNSISDYYKDFAVNIDKNTVKLGIKELDEKVRVTTSMLVALLAAPGAGKSSIALSIMNYVSNNDCKSIFFSMDMSVPQVYQRLLQKHTGEDSDLIIKNYRDNNLEKIEQYQKILAIEYNNVKFSFKSGLTVEMMRDVIIKENEVTGIMPKLVVVDYLECIKTQFTDSNASKSFAATALKDMANELGVCVLLLVQPRLASGNPSGELNSYTDIKGSSVISEASAIIMTMSRPGFNPQDISKDKFATINVVKNRMGGLSSTDLGWEGLTGNLRMLSQDEKLDLKNLRENIKSQTDEEHIGSGQYKSKYVSHKSSGDLY